MTNGAEGMTGMGLVERYLKVLAANLPAATRDDIIDELRESILSQLEALEEQLGRKPTDAEVETVLREVGHPLTVAARYRSGPQVLIGPELYPWWMFIAKIGLCAIAAFAGLEAIVKFLMADASLGKAIGASMHGLTQNVLTFIGMITIVGFFMDRQAEKPSFMAKWRVKDLELFELGGGFDADSWAKRVSTDDKDAVMTGTDDATPKPAKAIKLRPSPARQAATSAVFHGVLLAWWTGVLPGTVFSPTMLAWMLGGADYGALLSQTVEVAYLPVALFIAARIGFDILRVMTGGNKRLTALGDMLLSIAVLLGFVWVWLWSPMSPVVWVPDLPALIARVQSLFGVWMPGDGKMAAILTVVVVLSMISEAFKIWGAGARLIGTK